MTKKRPIIIDMDPGIDDAIALLILEKFKEHFEIKLLASTAGNCSIDITTSNTMFFAKNFFNGVCVAKGSDFPLTKRKVKDSSDVHSKSGLGDFKIPKNIDYPCDDNSVISMARILKNSKRKITIITLGALTNIARLVTDYPHLKNKIEVIYSMIGSISGIGNVTPYAEFNAYFDPEAFEIVANSNIPMIINPIELGINSIIKKSDLINSLNNTSINIMLKQIVQGLHETIGSDDDICLYDPNTIIAILKPEFYDFIPCDIYVSLNKADAGKCILTKNKNSIHYYQQLKDYQQINNFIIETFNK